MELPTIYKDHGTVARFLVSQFPMIFISIYFDAINIHCFFHSSSHFFWISIGFPWVFPVFPWFSHPSHAEARGLPRAAGAHDARQASGGGDAGDVFQNAGLADVEADLGISMVYDISIVYLHGI